MKKEKTNEYVAGWQTEYSIPDAMKKGMHTVIMMQKAASVVPTNLDDDKWAGLDDEMEIDFDEVGDGDLEEL